MKKRPTGVDKPPSRRVTLAIIGSVLCVCLVCCVLVYTSTPPKRSPHQRKRGLVTVADVESALQNGDTERAENMAQDLLTRTPESAAVLLIAARVKAELGQTSEAIAYCDRVPQDQSPEAEVAAWVPCELLFRNGALTQATERLERLLKTYPGHREARQRLIEVLVLSGRRWEAQPHYFKQLELLQIDSAGLIALGETSRIFDASEKLWLLEKQNPLDPLPRLGLARLELANQHYSTAAKRLRTITRESPQLIEAWARLGEALFQLAVTGESRETLAELIQWNTQLPALAESHPEVWVVRGRMAEQCSELDTSARCYWEAVKHDPNHIEGLYRLGKTLQVIEREKDAEAVLKRHRLTVAIRQSLDKLSGRAPPLESVLELSQMMQECGRSWEAWGWLGVARSLAPEDATINRQFRQMASILTPAGTLPQLPFSLDDLPDFSLERITLANWGKARRPGLGSQVVHAVTPPREIRFVDETKQRGLDFNYFCSPTPGVEGKHMYEFGGGGVAVLDFDLDGWQDVYLTQGCEWPPNQLDTREVSPHNLLCRNAGGQGFEPVATVKAAADTGFGQGATIGDFDGDGFPDIFVANIGPNRLYMNNGDGTFSDASNLLGPVAERPTQWTTSCVMVDLNDDGLCDIYEVNYLRGKDIFDRVCVWQQGKRRICGPATFSPDQDQLYLNTGSAFDNISNNSGIEIPPGNGLGVVAAVFCEPESPNESRLQLFVANDQEPNFLFRFTSNTMGDNLYDDSAVIRGLAYDARGAPQACMGVATGDCDGDGRLDLFVTNYYQESNTLYLQTSPGQFVDGTKAAELHEPSFSLLGFGTQFLDADADGDLDLIVTNGHLDDFAFLGQPYEMPPQFFQNNGHGRFAELKSETLGPYFAKLLRGRSLARFDWNRDGREDVVISHLDTPVALLTNATLGAGNYLALELHGVQSARDPIGTAVTLVTGDGRSLTRQLTAGDGYQASNARQLLFGLGEANAVARILVNWPSGLQQEITEHLDLNRQYILVEGQPVQWASKR
ncbi:MAG: FG-GAP-like repeat-containing protein [Pirellulaceae bacterium]